MKKIFTLIAILFISFSVKAQLLDTVLIRGNVTLQGQDWAWVVGKHGNVYSDSTTAKEFRRIRDHVQNWSNVSWTGNLSIDSLRGATVLWIYQTVKSANAGEIVTRYSAIVAATNKPEISYWINLFDANLLADYQRSRDKGKTLLIDN